MPVLDTDRMIAACLELRNREWNGYSDPLMANLGSRFRARREEQGCTLDDIAARTKIPLRLLVDLEGNTFASWPASRVYRVGYLRAYAAAVGLDAAQVIAQFDAENGPSHPGSFAARDGHRRPAARRPVVSLTIALVCSCAGALLIGLPFYLGPAQPVAAQSVVVTDIAGGPEGPRDIALEPAPAGTTAVATSGGSVESDEIEGELRIDSVPSGTHVVVNGIARGTTPIRLQYLPVGSYTIRLVRDGYESQEASAALTTERPVRSISMTLRERAR